MAPRGTDADAPLVPAQDPGPRRLDRRVRSLCGTDWTMREALGETWRWYVDKPLEDWRNNVAEAARRGQSAPGWWPASVPGSVVTDLWRAGELRNPYRGRGSRAAEWTGHRSWVYRRTVELPALADDEWGVLEFDGIDPAASVFWDGRPLGRVPGSYAPGRFAIPADAADAGPHRVAVVVDPVPASQPQVGRTELVRVHRPRMNEGWDFCPRFPHQGIWRDVRLAVGPVHLASVAVTTRLDGHCHGTVRLTAMLEVADDRPVPVDLALLDAGGRVVAERRDRVDGGTVRELRLDLDVPRPELWWPRGFGAATVYTTRLRLSGGAEPAWSGTVGFRRATLVANAGAPSSARPYTAVVNDRVVPLHGWNWVPADAQYGAVEPHRVRHLVGLAARSGTRLLRVWGGGLIETEEFYDACDRAGLLVWQEFSQSSSGLQSAPATDGDFVRLMTAEAAAVVPARAHHPSLLIWGGGNELDLDGVPLDEERSPVLAALRDAVRRLDPGRAWLPTSPSGPAFHHRLDVIAAAPEDQHDVHGPWEHQGLRHQHTLANAGSCLAHTEFGVEGMTNRRALDELLPDGDRWPADRTNPAYRHLGDWWNNEPLVQASFGHRLTDLDALLRASQLLQATGLAYAVEADRRRFPYCSLVLPWQLNESYPNAWCTSCVDHRGDPKPAFHAVTRAFAPRRVTVRVPTAVWAGEDRLTAQAWVWAEQGVAPGSRVHARLRAAGGRILAERRWRLDGPVEHPCPAGTMTVDARLAPSDAVVVWELVWESAEGAPLDREVVLACTGPDFTPLLDLAPATLDVTARAADGAAVVEVAHRSGPLVVGLQIVDDRPADAPGWVIGDGDPRPLLPGEAREFLVRGERAPPPMRVRVEAWNTSPTRIELDEEQRP
ncbi:MAG: glycoside hydrolase family 2 TIM barrel-domain containing protein [Micromonospora sp.]